MTAAARIGCDYCMVTFDEAGDVIHEDTCGGYEAVRLRQRVAALTAEVERLTQENESALASDVACQEAADKELAQRDAALAEAVVLLRRCASTVPLIHLPLITALDAFLATPAAERGRRALREVVKELVDAGTEVIYSSLIKTEEALMRFEKSLTAYGRLAGGKQWKND